MVIILMVLSYLGNNANDCATHTRPFCLLARTSVHARARFRVGLFYAVCVCVHAFVDVCARVRIHLCVRTGVPKCVRSHVCIIYTCNTFCFTRAAKTLLLSRCRWGTFNR